jgi:type I restriction enzyme R subunit
MEHIANNMQKKPLKQRMTKGQIIGLLSSNSNLMDEQEDLTEYINSLDWNSGQDVNSLHTGYGDFKTRKNEQELTHIAGKHGLSASVLKEFTDKILHRMFFDGEKLTDLLIPLELRWKERRTKELALMADLAPLLKKRAQGREISGLAAYE